MRYVLEGSVRKAGNRVRITGQLIDTATGAHIWADRFDGALDDIFELQDQVASNVAGAIEPKLRQSEIERASRKTATSPLTTFICAHWRSHIALPKRVLPRQSASPARRWRSIRPTVPGLAMPQALPTTLVPPPGFLKCSTSETCLAACASWNVIPLQYRRSVAV